MKGALRGSSLGGPRSGHLPDPIAGELAPRQAVTFWCGRDHEMRVAFAHDVVPPETMPCRHCGAEAGTERHAPPATLSAVPYKTHLQYTQERRTPEDAETLLAEALSQLRSRQGQ